MLHPRPSLAAAADWLSPDKAYEKRWAAIVIERVLALLAEENSVAGKGLLFDHLKDSLWGEGAPYAQIASCLGLTEGAVKASAHRLRQRCRELLRAEIAQTVAQPEDINEELRHLVAVFGA